LTTGRSPSSRSDDPRVIAAVEEYLRRVETGQRPSIDAFLAEHAEIAESLRPCLAGLRFVREAAEEIEASSAGIGGRLAAEEMSTEPLGDFQLIREIGRGGMGIVYEAEQRSLRRRVAVKILPLAAILDERRLERFRHEAAVAALLKHPHIVSVYWVGCERGVHYYAMELIEGQTLAQIIAERSSADAPPQSTISSPAPRSGIAPDSPDVDKTPDQRSLAERDTVRLTCLHADTVRSEATPEFDRMVARIGIQSAEALEHAHSHGVIHRDIKPSNIMVGGDGQVWLTDFGLAHIESEPSLTLTGDLVGTLRYMSPEQAAGQPALVDHRTDIYSLGATLYELATGKPVIEAGDRAFILRQIAEREPTAPSKLVKRMPRDLETIILKSLSKESSGRYATARQMADDLSRFLEDKPVQARRPGLVRHTIKWARRNRVIVTTAVVTFLLSLIVGVVLIARAYQSERAQRKIAENERTLAKSNLLQARRNLQLARSAVEDMYLNIATQWLAKETGASKLQREFLDKALQIYQRLARASGEDSYELRAAAVAYERMGDIHVYLQSYARGRAAYQEAIALEEELNVPETPSAERLTALAARTRKLAEASLELGLLDDAERAYVSMLEQLAESDDRILQVTDPKEALRFQLGRAALLSRQDHPAQAEALLREAQQACERLDAGAKGTSSVDRMMLRSHCGFLLAAALRDQSRLGEAEEICAKALEQCRFIRLSEYHDSRSQAALELSLEDQVADLARARGKFDEAHAQLQRILELRRRNLIEGKDPAMFFFSLLSLDPEMSHDRGWEEGPFCDYVETQLRLADVLGRSGRPYAAECVLGECVRTSVILSESRGDVLRYRVGIANSWAQVGELLADRRPEESKQAWAFAGELWHETIKAFPQAGNYRSGVHGPLNDFTWFEKQRPQHDKPSAGEKVKDPLWGTLFGEFAYARLYWRHGDWKDAIGAFQKSANLRRSGHAYDWFHIAMVHSQLGQHAEARQWYDKAVESMRKENPEDVELEELRRETSELLGSQRPPT
jgi:serine/threonine protein kinase/tetratricopeptide (TPR) repeat protein